MKLEFKNYWFKMYAAVADGDVTQIEALERMDIFDFFEVFKLYEERVEREIQSHEGLKNRLGGKNRRQKKD